MSIQLEHFFRAAPDTGAMDRALPDGTAVTFELEGDGGGVWTLESAEDGITVVRQDHVAPDCRLRCSVDDFEALLRGSLDRDHAFFDGRLEVEGDVGLVLRLQRALGRTLPA